MGLQAVLGTPGFKTNGIDNLSWVAFKAESITTVRLGAEGDAGAMEG